MMIRTYSELITLKTFDDRFNYLKLEGSVGVSTFGFDRFMNQKFYKSKEWLRIRDYVIMRDTIGDYCCDLGIEGHEISGKILIHHMNPIRQKDIIESTEYLLNPEFLIATIHDTHNAIHYGDDSILTTRNFAERKPYDTCPWKN